MSKLNDSARKAVRAFGALLGNVDLSQVPEETIEWINQHPSDAGKELTKWMLNGCRLMIGEPKVIQIDRSKSFDIKKFLSGDWKIDEEDKRALAITELDLTKVQFVDMLKPGESFVGGEEKQKRLAKAGHTCLDAKIFQTLWENQALIPPSWKEKINGDTRIIYFNGTILRSPNGRRCVRCLFWDGDQWDWSCRWLGDRWDAQDVSAVLAD